jgi:hypothetical protein
MIPPDNPFPTMDFPSSKGGNVDLRDVFAKGTSIIGVVPHQNREAWLEAAAKQITDWMLNKFVNVYLVLNVTPEEARRVCDEYGIQAPILCDVDGVMGPDAQGFYRVNGEGTIEAAVDDVAMLDKLSA